MTPNEYREVWEAYMKNDDPMICSEHRHSYQNTQELPDITVENAHITLYAISCTRFEAAKAVESLKIDGIRCNLFNILWLKPFDITDRLIQPLKESKLGLVIDPGHEIAGAAKIHSL